MYHSTFAIAILVLMLMLFFGSPSSMNPDGFKRIAEAKSIQSTAKSLVLWELSATTENKKKPQVDNWKQLMSSMSFPRPSDILDSQWHYGEDPTKGRYWCLLRMSKPSSHVLSVFKEASILLSNEGEIRLSTTCNSGNVVDDSADISTIDTIAMTLYSGV